MAGARVYVCGRNRNRPPIYHVERGALRTACGLTIDVDEPLNRVRMMGWATKNDAEKVASPCRNCFG
jgi:hypothetical protein